MLKLARSIGRWLLLGTLFVSLGGHLVLLQSLAWANMLVGFSRTESFSQAAKKTFDGEHPCPLCKAVSKSRQQEEKKPLVKAEAKMDMLLPSGVVLAAPCGIPLVQPLPGYSGRHVSISLGVPLQPPRLV